MELQWNKKVIHSQQAKLKKHSLIITETLRIEKSMEEQWASWAGPDKLSLLLL